MVLRLKSMRQKGYSLVAVGDSISVLEKSHGAMWGAQSYSCPDIRRSWCIPQSLAESFRVSLGTKVKAAPTMIHSHPTTWQATHKHQWKWAAQNQSIYWLCNTKKLRRERETSGSCFHAATFLKLPHSPDSFRYIEICRRHQPSLLCFTTPETSSPTGTQGITKHLADKLQAGQESWMLMQYQTMQASCAMGNLQIFSALY